MLLRLFLFILSVSCVPNPFKEDYVYWFLKTHRNPKIDPCENFYRHVCPVGISKDDTLMQVHLGHALRWILNGEQILKNENEWEILEMANYSSIPKAIVARTRRMAHKDKNKSKEKSEKHLAKTINENEDRMSKMFTNQVRDRMKMAAIVLNKLPLRLSMLYDVQKNPENPLFGENFTRIENNSVDLIESIVKKIQASDQYSAKLKKYVEGAIQDLTVTTAFIHETDEVVQFYKEILKQLSANIKELESLNLTPADGLVYLNGLSKGLSSIEESLLFLIKYTAIPNSVNYRDHVTMAETFFLPSLMSNATLSSILAHYGFILGHEISHSFVQQPSSEYSAFAKDPTFVKNIRCVRRMMEKACILWGETACGSGDGTLDEDGPDVFGMSSTYALLKEYLGNDLNQYEYEDLKITKEQHFFYSEAVLWCVPYKNSQHVQRDVHSSALIRTNGVFSMMPEFHNAFNCKKHQLMVQRDRCAFYETGTTEGT